MMLKFIGNGWLIGVPARNLTEAEASQFGGEEKLLESGLYEKSQDIAAEDVVAEVMQDTEDTPAQAFARGRRNKKEGE